MMVRVECRPGHRDEPMPLRLLFGARRVELVEILDWWPGSDHHYFKARGEDGALYILRHDVARNAWELTMYQSASYSPEDAEHPDQRGAR